LGRDGLAALGAKGHVSGLAFRVQGHKLDAVNALWPAMQGQAPVSTQTIGQALNTNPRPIKGGQRVMRRFGNPTADPEPIAGAIFGIQDRIEALRFRANEQALR